MKRLRWLALFVMGAILLSACGGASEADNSPAPPQITKRPVERTFDGYGNDVTPLFTLNPGLVRFEYAHAGDSNFIVWLLDSDGNDVDLVVNEIGKYEGASATRIDAAGKYLLEVTASGGWAIRVTQ